MKRLLFLFAILMPVLLLSGQELTNDSDTLRKDALNVFMEADDYTKKEIPFVNYVRDIRDAQVYIITSSRRTGSGGTEFSYFLVGQKDFDGMKDTIVVMTNPDDTQDAIRAKRVRALKMGLMRYVVQTPLADFIDVRFTVPMKETVTSDKWNSWVFRASMSGFLQGQKTYKSHDLNLNTSASRVTESMRTDIGAYYSYGKEIYDISGTTYESESNSKSLDFLNVWAINNHWSYGISVDVNSSTYSNNDLSISVFPAIEYNIFPYAESTRRQLRLMYRLGYEYRNYTDTTVFDKMEDNLVAQSMSASYSVVQKWGSAGFSLNYRNYLHDMSIQNLGLSGSMSLRVAKGLSLNFGGSANMVRDQIALKKGAASPEEILLRRREMATNFRYFSHFGLSYTFGSIYNNVVNPRFGGSSSGGGMTIIMN
jgi:hypothetical protein